MVQRVMAESNNRETAIGPPLSAQFPNERQEERSPVKATRPKQHVSRTRHSMRPCTYLVRSSAFDFLLIQSHRVQATSSKVSQAQKEKGLKPPEHAGQENCPSIRRPSPSSFVFALLEKGNVETDVVQPSSQFLFSSC